LLVSLVAKLNDAFGLNLDTDPCTARSMADINEQREADSAEKIVAVLGSSHATRLTDALLCEGVTGATSVTDSGWKLSRDSVQAAVKILEEMLVQPDSIVLEILDNNAFFCAMEDGSVVLPAHGKDGKYHVTGDLKVATKQQTENLYKLAEPLLKWSPDTTKLLVLPMPRYVHPDLVCCKRDGHVTNKGPGLLDEIKADLAGLKRTFRSTMFKNKIKNVRLVDPVPICNFAVPEIFADPVHLTGDGYGVLAAAIKKLVAGTEPDGKSADQSGSEESNKRIRTLSMGRGGPSNMGRGMDQWGRGWAPLGRRPYRGSGSGRGGSWSR
jgi:hypothetical protein